MRLLTAIVAPPGTGKSELGKELAARWKFHHVIGSDVIKWAHQHARPQDPPLEDRGEIQSFYREWSAREGRGIIGKTILRMMEGTGDDLRLCYDGVRNRHDALAVKRADGIIIALDCPLEVSHQRFNERKRCTVPPKEFKPLTFEEYMELVRRENQINDENGLHLDEVMGMARLRVEATHPIDVVARTLVHGLRELGIRIDD